MLNKTMIAPCGMNCAICLAHQRSKKRCEGCNGHNESKPSHCVKCVIKNCEHIKTHPFCYSCEKYPCRRLRQLDARYRKNYGMSMLENLEHIRDKGLISFLESEAHIWTCSSCGKLVCVHKNLCLHCKTPYQLP